MDGYNTDSIALLHYLPNAPTSIILSESTAAQALADLRDPRFHRIWVLRNTHDISPHHLTTAIEAGACEGRRTRREPWERAVMRLAGIQQPPSHFY